MRLKHYLPRRIYSPGFTLVELMIAIAISAILMLGVAQVFVSSRHSFKLDNGLARAQENARFAVHTMGEDIRMAGYIGCRAANVANMLNNTASWMFDFDTPLQGWDGSHLAAYPLPAGFPAITAGTDAIVVLHADNTEYKIVLDKPNAASMQLNTTVGLSPDDIVMASDCSEASIFQLTTVSPAKVEVTHNAGNGVSVPGNCSKNVGSPRPTTCTANSGNQSNFGANSGSLMKLKATAYYIAPSSSGSGTSLWSASMDKGVLGPPVEMAEGVENMQILYGVDTDADKIANQYLRADQVAAITDGFKKVVSVRIGLLLETTTDVLNGNNTKQYTIADVNVPAGTGANTHPTDKKLRFPITTTIKLRNRGIM